LRRNYVNQATTAPPSGGAVVSSSQSRERRFEQRPREDVLQLEDGCTTFEAKNLDDLVAQLRQRYPDGEYERTLHRERDRQAEQRRADAMHNLIEILVNAFVKD